MKKELRDSGVVLISVMMLVALLLITIAAYYKLTSRETSNVRHSAKSATGFYSAEAGLNLRAEEIRAIFTGYNQPQGNSPNPDNACTSGNMGSGDYQCKTFSFNKRDVVTYMIESEDNPINTTIPPGEPYQNLTTQEYNYTTVSVSKDSKDRPEMMLELQFKSRLVPLFQFAVFYDKDLEILPGANMTLAGPVYTNGDLYLNANGALLTIQGQTMAAGKIYRGRKDNSSTSCNSNSVKIFNSANVAKYLIPSCPSRYQVKKSEIASWNGMIQQGVQKVTVPGPDIFDPVVGATYFDKADLRLMMVINDDDSLRGIEVRTPQNALDANATNIINNASTCPGNRGGKVFKESNFWNLREGGVNRLLDIDMQALLNCLKNTSWFGTGKRLDDDSEGGLVFHFSVSGKRSEYASSLYGVRLGNAATLQSSSGTPIVKGVTVVSDQAIYTWGHYNSVNKIPAAIMADTVGVLSPNWKDTNCGTSYYTCQDLNKRKAVATTVNAALLTATDTTGNIEGAGGQGGNYNGGYENSIRFQEGWSGVALTYTGSIVSLNTPQHSSGSWRMGEIYSAPIRNWTYDTSFNSAENLPPLTPRFVYLRQELFERDFEQ